MLDFSEPGGGLFSSDPGDHSSDKSIPQPEGQKTELNRMKFTLWKR